MLRKKAIIIVIAVAVVTASIMGGYILGRASTAKIVEPVIFRNSMGFIEYTAFEAIMDEVKPDNLKNVYTLRTMYDENQNRYWVEFYDTQSHLSCLWVGVVVIDAIDFDVVYTDTDIRLYSGISPEMAAASRGSQNELHNEYGDFYTKYFLD